MSGARFRFVRRVLPSISTTCIAAYAHRNAGPAAISVFQRRSTMTRTATKPYNYLIVGGGTAGLVVARRLSEDGTKRVLVLEAGASRLDDDNINVPGHLGQLFGNPQYDWDFSSVPQVSDCCCCLPFKSLRFLYSPPSAAYPQPHYCPAAR